MWRKRAFVRKRVKSYMLLGSDLVRYLVVEELPPPAAMEFAEHKAVMLDVLGDALAAGIHGALLRPTLVGRIQPESDDTVGLRCTYKENGCHARSASLSTSEYLHSLKEGMNTCNHCSKQLAMRSNG